MSTQSLEEKYQLALAALRAVVIEATPEAMIKADSVLQHLTGEVSTDDDPTFFYWVVRLGVHRTWVADGFTLDDDQAHYMLARYLNYAYGHELSAQVLASPPRRDILTEQGYEGEALEKALKEVKK